MLLGISISLSEGFALMALATAAPMSQQALAEQLHLDKSTVSRLVKSLEKKGWIKRVRDLNDTRVFQVHLSKEGRETAARLLKEMTQRHERLLAELKPDEQEALAYGLSAIIRAFQTIEEKERPSVPPPRF
jgi:DNA-binding MarR family transcriptional regulator